MANDRIDELFKDGRAIDEAVNAAVRRALWEHKLFNNPVCTARDGRVEWIAPRDIPADPADPPLPAAG